VTSDRFLVTFGECSEPRFPLPGQERREQLHSNLLVLPELEVQFAEVAEHPHFVIRREDEFGEVVSGNQARESPDVP
jgi:hypothetical protein